MDELELARDFVLPVGPYANEWRCTELAFAFTCIAELLLNFPVTDVRGPGEGMPRLALARRTVRAVVLIMLPKLMLNERRRPLFEPLEVEAESGGCVGRCSFSHAVI